MCTYFHHILVEHCNIFHLSIGRLSSLLFSSHIKIAFELCTAFKKPKFKANIGSSLLHEMFSWILSLNFFLPYMAFKQNVEEEKGGEKTMLGWWCWSFRLRCSIPFPLLANCAWMHVLILLSKKQKLTWWSRTSAWNNVSPDCFVLVFSLHYSKWFRMCWSQTTQCHNSVWKQSAPFSAITVDFHWNSNSPKLAFKAPYTPLFPREHYRLISARQLCTPIAIPRMHFLYCCIIATDRALSTNVVIHPRHVLRQTGLAVFEPTDLYL